MRIGYDGRLHPASTAATTDAGTQFDAEKIGKVAAAQPKFMEGVMKMFDSAGGAAKQISVGIEKRREREDDIEDAEMRQRAVEAIDEERRKIEGNDSLTPRQKRDALGKLGENFAFPGETKGEGDTRKMPIQTTGKPTRDRPSALFLRKKLYDVASSAYDEARRAEQHAVSAAFDADVSVGIVNFQTSFAGEADKWVAEGVSLDDVGEKLRSLIEDNMDGANPGADPVKVAKLEAAKNQAVAAAMLSYAKMFAQKKSGEAKASVAKTMSAIASSSGGDLDSDNEAIRAVVFGSIGEFGGDANEAEWMMNGGVMTCADSFVAKCRNEFSVESANDALARQDLVERGDEDGFNENVKAAKKKIEDTHKFLSERYDRALKLIEDNVKEKNDKDVIIKWAKSEIGKRKTELDKWKAAETAKLYAESGRTHKSAGKKAAGDLKDFYNGKDVSLTDVALDVHQLIAWNPYSEFSMKKTSKESRDQAVFDAFVAQNFAGISPSGPNAEEAVVMNLKYAITCLEDAGDNANLFDVKRIMECAGELFGYGSDCYLEVARFAYENIRKENNGVPNEQKADIARTHVLGGAKLEECAPEVKRRFFQVKAFLDEIPKEEFDKFSTGGTGMVQDLVNNLRSEARYDFILAPSAISDKMKSAKAAVRGMSEGPLDVAKETAQFDELPEVKELLRGEEIAVKDAELKSITEGRRAVYSKEIHNMDKRRALYEYWKKKAIDVGALDENTIEKEKKYSLMSGTQILREITLRKVANKAKLRKDSEDKPGLIKEMRGYDLPLNRSAYTSFMGIGGHPINESDEIELGINHDGDRRLTVDEMREVLRQYHAYTNRIRRKEAEVAAEKKRIEDEIAAIRKRGK